MQKTNQWPKRKLMLFSVVFLALFFLLTEIICRIVLYLRYRHFQTNAYIQGSPLKEDDSMLVYRNAPFYLDYNLGYQNNAAGMKSQPGEVAPILPKSKGVFRVLLTGASAMEGMGSSKRAEWLDIAGQVDHPWNQTICYYLQQFLQDSMPGKKVEVFNAACSGYQAWQSFGRWQELAPVVAPDWVISMDGANEPTSFPAGQSARKIQEKDWASGPQFHFPLNAIITMTQHFACINLLKQWLFQVKESARLQKAISNNYPARQHWLQAVSPAERFATAATVAPAIDSFLDVLHRYDSALTHSGTPHLLLVQPYLSLRDTLVSTSTEQALLHYYQASINDSLKNAFMRGIHTIIGKQNASSSIVSMAPVHDWSDQVFVDYCHFTGATNKKIAFAIGHFILSNRSSPLF